KMKIKRLAFYRLWYPVFLYLILFIPYCGIYLIVNYDGIESVYFLINYLTMFIIVLISYRVFSFVINNYNPNLLKITHHLNIIETIIILFIFLLLSSLIINPMSFLLVVAPIKTNIFLHLV